MEAEHARYGEGHGRKAAERKRGGGGERWWGGTNRIVSTLNSEPNAGVRLGMQLCLGGDKLKLAKQGRQYLKRYLVEMRERQYGGWYDGMVQSVGCRESTVQLAHGAE